MWKRGRGRRGREGGGVRGRWMWKKGRGRRGREEE